MTCSPQRTGRSALFGGQALGLLMLVSGLLAAVVASGAPALIPAPKSVEWTDAKFKARNFNITCPAEANAVAGQLGVDLIAAGGRAAVFSGEQSNMVGRIVLQLGDSGSAASESYAIVVTAQSATVTARQPVGLLYGVQTLRQLITPQDGQPVIAGGRIQDEPAFAWRGFMHDVGRNFQDITLLKRFVDVMARYKLNVFHFHLTDNPAWRIECRVHPELNSPTNTPATRSPGKFYTYAELNDFIAYARERGVRVVPEIDMPGHSEYFHRAFGVDMQSEAGMKILAECVNEFLDNVKDVDVVHIGSDEVAIKNKNFLPRMAELIRSRGKQIIVWRPGGMPPGKVITQAWSAGGRANAPLKGQPYLDSRDDYVNHLDPFDLPHRELNLSTCGQPTGDEFALGGILCHWPDNNAGSQMNIYAQSPVFPALLSAAERYWRGHTPQQKTFWGRLPDAGTSDFARVAEFEARMLEHRNRFFADWPFPYVKQTDIAWKLIGPFDHKGDVTAAFPVESELRDEYVVDGRTNRWVEARGATIHINHFWYDGWLPKAVSGTAYALTYVWSPRAQNVGFWINFNGPSRSDRRGGPNPAQGEWSTTSSRLWVNDAPIAPPVWKQPGAVWGGVEAPFVDEDYFYRPPTDVALKQGWNKILVKAPRSAKTWKWKFTCVPVSVNGNNVREVEGLRFATSPKETKL